MISVQIVNFGISSLCNVRGSEDVAFKFSSADAHIFLVAINGVAFLKGIALDLSSCDVRGHLW